ncbi:hypothetical protein SAMN06298216_4060 [Spirosomataceae bacterium TFI 002]|nr:hypothetical protein SAMN06298216_4060 [Spirosomataceae bacterium TFI 002]
MYIVIVGLIKKTLFLVLNTPFKTTNNFYVSQFPPIIFPNHCLFI